MAVPVARVHLAMAHGALPGLLPTPPRCMMFPLLPAPPCAIILPNNSCPRSTSHAKAAGRWDAHKIRPAGSPSASSSSRSSCETRDSNKKIVTTMPTSSPSRTGHGSSNGNSRADSEERWDAHKKPASPASPSPSSATSRSKTCRRPNSRASPSSSAERWDAHKKPRAPQRPDELDDGESSTGSNDVAEFMDTPRQQLPPRSFYAGPGFITAPEPSMLPKPSFMIRVA